MSAVLASLPSRTSGSPRGRRTIPPFMSPFESINVHSLTLFIKPPSLPEEKITARRVCGRIIIRTTTAPSSSIRTATTSKSFVTKRPANGRRRSKFPVQGSTFNSKRRLPSLGGTDHNLNHSARRQYSAHGGAGGEIGSIDPSHPSFVHFVLQTGISHVNRCAQDPRLMGAGLGKDGINFFEYLFGLPFHWERLVVGDDTRKIDHVPVHHRTTIPFPRVDSFYVHNLSFPPQAITKSAAFDCATRCSADTCIPREGLLARRTACLRAAARSAVCFPKSRRAPITSVSRSD